MTEQNEALQRYLKRVTPIFREMFGIAHAITDQYETAEYVVEKAIQTGYTGKSKVGENMTFNEMMKLRVIRIAREQVRQHGQPPEGEGTWSGFDNVDVSDNVFLSEAVREPLLMRRVLMMKFGAGLHSYEIAPIIGLDKTRVRSYLQQFEARVMRKMQGKNVSYERLAHRAAQIELSRLEADTPDSAATFRQLQADMVDTVKDASVSPISRMISYFFLGLGVALCILLFWLFSILMDPNLAGGGAQPAEAVQEIAEPENIEFNP